MGDYVAGLERAEVIVRSLAFMGRKCGQNGEGPAALDAAADAIRAEQDQEPTPPMGTIICQCCGAPRPAR